MSSAKSLFAEPQHQGLQSSSSLSSVFYEERDSSSEACYEDEQLDKEATENKWLQDQELGYLANTFAGNAAAALQRGSQGDWIRLMELLQIMQPVGNALLQFHGVQHYVQRIYQHFLSKHDTFCNMKLQEVLNLVFSDYKHNEMDELYPCVGKQIEHQEKCSKNESPKIIDDNSDLFQLSWQEVEKKLKPRPLNLIDIQSYLPRVVSEISRQEAVWKSALGLTLFVANTKLPYDVERVPSEPSIETVSSLKSLSEDKSFYVKPKAPKSGLEVVEYFVRNQSIEVTKIWYLNANSSDIYDPYDLVVVSRNRVRPDSYVISVFGVLHVKPEGESELVSLGQWYREAVVFRTLRKIKYFRTYLIFKAFVTWKKNVKLLRFLKLRKEIKDSHLLGVPHILKAILKVKSLLSEMQSVTLFPNDVKSCYTLDQFNEIVCEILQNAKNYATRLYSHCQVIVSKVEGDCLEYLHYCMQHMEQKTDNIKESMTLAKQRRIKLTKNLNVAKRIEMKLPCFARLIQEMLNQFMLSYITENISSFVYEMMTTEDSQREGLFTAWFEFDPETSLLALSPSPAELMNSLERSLHNVPEALQEACKTLQLADNADDNDNDIQGLIKSQQRLTADELRILLSFGPKEANDAIKNCITKKHVLRKTIEVFEGTSDLDEETKLYQPGTLEAKLNNDELIRQCTASMEDLMQSAFTEVNLFSDEHAWIATIHSFVITWNQGVLMSWKGQSASKIEKQVKQIRRWTDQVQRIDRSLRTSNGILLVDNSHIQETIVPGLQAILTNLMDMTTSHCLLSSEELIKELNDLSKTLSVQTSTIEEFASLYQKLSTCKESSANLQSRHEYVKSIFEVIRHCYRQLTPDEEETEERVTNEWNSFLYMLQYAKDNVNELLPKMLENLESSIGSLEAEALEITEKATSGKFLDSTQSPKTVLPELKELHARFITVKEELLRLAQCKQILENEAHDLTSLSELHAKIMARHELWKYCEVTTFAIKGWMHTLFFKLQVKKVAEKVAKWREAVSTLKPNLPTNDDVLCSWVQKIDDFCLDLPLLQELFSVSLKHRHWKWLFAGLGQVYDPSRQYLLSDLISFGLRNHAQLISSICDSAAAECALESHMKKLIKRWEDEEFKLMKFFQEGQTEKKKRNKNAQNSVERLENNGKRSHDDLFILTGVNELQSQVESDLVTLQSMLVSPHLSETRSQAEAWSGCLHQLKEILDMWVSCQQKWIYLKKIFSSISPSNANVSKYSQDFHDIDMKYQEYMTAVVRDPKVLSVLEKRGEKGCRELQGENLREMFIDMVAKQEQIIKNLNTYLDSIRASFPRLFFLSNNEMLELLAISQSPKALVPFVRKCFPGIADLKFVLPPSVASNVRSHLDAALNAHHLEVACMYGDLGEEISLQTPVAPEKSVEKWLSAIEFAMKNVLWNKMSHCIEERLLCTPSINKLLTGLVGIANGELYKDGKAKQRISSTRAKMAIDESENAYWYLVYPFQCVIAAEEVIWTRQMENALVKGGFESVADVRNLLLERIQHYCDVLQTHSLAIAEKDWSHKLTIVTQNLLARSLYHRDVAQVLDKQGVDEKGFQWLQTFKYHIDISHDERKRTIFQSGSNAVLCGPANAAKFGRLSISQLKFSMPYGYEYQGPATRMVITPLTDRALLNITTAMNLHYTGGLFGPSEAGKTSTVQEVAKILGSQLVLFTCQPSISLSKILQFISGAVQSGSLLCFENATCLPSNILAVLGQHLDDIRQALAALQRRKFCQFEVRDPNILNQISEKEITKRNRGYTVISLHPLVTKNPQSSTESDEQLQVLTSLDKGINRRHSIAEIASFNHRQSTTSISSSYLRGVKSEFVLPNKDEEEEEPMTSLYEEIKPLGKLMVNGALITANPLFGCLLTIPAKDRSYPSIPDNLRNTARLFGTVYPDHKVIIKVWLIQHGFKQFEKLAAKLFTFKEMLRDQYLGSALYTIHLSRIKKIIDLAKKMIAEFQSAKEPLSASSEPDSADRGNIEELCIGQAIYSTMFASVRLSDLPHFTRVVMVSFPQLKKSKKEGAYQDELLLSSVKQQVSSDSLYNKESFIEKVMQLHETMFKNRSVILLGGPGTGKSACYQTLCRSLCQFYSSWTQAVKNRKTRTTEQDSPKQDSSFSKVHLSTFYQKAMTTEEIYGGFSESQDWSDGILAKMIRTATQIQDISKDDEAHESIRETIQYWFVFDGPMDAGLTEPLESLLDSKNVLCLTNGERIKPPSSMRFIFETTDLANASPAILTRSAIVNFENNLVDWRCLYHSWRKSAQKKYKISIGLKVVKGMLEHIIGPLAEFLSRESSSLLSSSPSTRTDRSSCTTEVSSILQLVGAVLEKCISRDNTERAPRRESSPNPSETESFTRRASLSKDSEEIQFTSNAFAFAFVWAISGRLHERCHAAFDTFTRQLFAICPYSVIFPCSAFECIIDHATGELVRWQGSSTEMPRTIPSQNYIITMEIEKYFTIADLLVSSGANTLIVGDLGVGKTSFVKNVIQPKHRLHKIVFGQGLSSTFFQRTIQTYVEERQSRIRSNIVKPLPQQKGTTCVKNIFFTDDISMAAFDDVCKWSQPTLEVLRQMISEGGVYDQDRKYFQHLPNLQFLATCTSPRRFTDGSSNRSLNPRLVRRMNMINMKAFSNETLCTIYTSIYKSWLEEFPAYSLTHIEPFSKALAFASVDIFNRIKETFVQSSVQPQFIFSHHDLARIAKGVFLYSTKSRYKGRKSGGGGLFDKSLSIVNQSLPDFKTIDPFLRQDTGLSTNNLNNSLNLSNIDRTPASVSPLIRTIIRLWCHEVCRSFYDRLIEGKDKSLFSSTLHSIIMQHFCADIQENFAPSIQVTQFPENKSNKSRVKFKDIELNRNSVCHGPLISMNNLISEEETFTDFLFSKHLFIHGARGMQGVGDHEKGYAECLEAHVEEALRKSLNIIRSTENKAFDLVLYKEALHHAVRISRALALPGGHALLLSLHGHGRANVAKLVGKVANMKILSVSGAALMDHLQFRSIVKDACFVAGLQGKPVVLYIAENLCKDGLQDVAALLTDGDCPGLFSAEELAAISNHLLPGGRVGQRRTESKAVAQGRFTRRITANLHVIVCAQYQSLKSIVSDFPCFISRAACIDIYHEWTGGILKQVAENWLLSKGKCEFFYRVKWDNNNRDLQMKAIYATMAQVHISARAILDKDFRDLGIEIFSPLKFVEFVDLFRLLCSVFCREYENELEYLQRATDKVQKCKDYVQDKANSIMELKPSLDAAKVVLKQSEGKVKAATEDYQSSKQACIDQQKAIESLEIPLNALREDAKLEFGRLAPIYEAALVTLNSIDIYEVEEMRSYRDPPRGVKFVADMLCHMFGKPPNWEEAKLLLIRDNFFQDLVFYGKDNVPDALCKRLEKFCSSSESNPESLLLISRAASSISVWIRAVYDYCIILQAFRPKQLEIKEAENELNKARSLLGKKRVESHKMKTALENAIEVYKDILKETKGLEKQLQTLNRAKSKAESLLNSMDFCILQWYDRIEKLNKKLQAAPGDALLTAATVIYLAVLGDDIRECLQRDWIKILCKGVVLEHETVRVLFGERFSIKDILSNDDEEMEWKNKGFLNDSFMLTNALIARTCCLSGKKCWPLFIDPYNQAESIVRFIEQGLEPLIKETSSKDNSSNEQSEEIFHSRITVALFQETVASSLGADSSLRPNTRGNALELSLMSDSLLRDGNLGTSSAMSVAANSANLEGTKTPHFNDSRMSDQRRASAFSAVTNESAFLKKFYSKTGLKELPDSPVPSPPLDLDDDILQTVEADDEQLDQKLKSAVSKGVPTLVTNLERGVRGCLLNSLLTKNIAMSDDGTQSISYGKHRIDYHPNFRLYLCAAVSMDYNKKYRFSLPLHRTFVINLTTGKMGLEASLISYAARSEKPELENQRRSLDLDSYYLIKERKKLQDGVLEAVCDLPGKLLEEKTLPDFIADSKKQLNVTDERMREAETFRLEIESKWRVYYEVSSHCTELYKITQQISKLKPYYESPLQLFENQFKKTFEECKRSKAECGSSNARIAEILSNFSLDIYKRTCLNVFKEHAIFYPILVTTQKYQQDGTINAYHYEALLKLVSSNELPMQRNESEINFPDISEWLTEELILKISSLDLLEGLGGILKSFKGNLRQWKEYFEMPPNLACACPCGFQNLSIFHKALLWLAVLPAKCSKICQNFVLNSLGPSFTKLYQHTLADILAFSSSSIPILILLPDDKNTVYNEDPSLAIEAFGRSVNCQVILMSLGKPGQLKEAIRILRNCFREKRKKWIVLQNCHLEKGWSHEFFRLMEDLSMLMEQPSSIQGVNAKETGSFRLWLIFQCKSDLNIPVALSQRSLQVAWDEKYFSVDSFRANSNLSETVKDEFANRLNEAQLKKFEENLPNMIYFGLSSQRQFGLEILAHFKQQNDLGGEDKSVEMVDFTTERLLFSSKASHVSANFGLKDIIKREKPSLSLLKKELQVLYEGRGFQSSAVSLLKWAKCFEDSCCKEVVASKDEEFNGIINQLQGVYESLEKKASPRISKSVYQYFHREIKAARDLAGFLLSIIYTTHSSLGTSELKNSTLANVKHRYLSSTLQMKGQVSIAKFSELVTDFSSLSNALLSYIRPKSRQPLGYDANMIPHIEGFFASVKEDFCNENFVNVEDVQWKAKAVVVNEKLLPPVNGVYFKDVSLQNANWNYDTGQISLGQDTVTRIPLLHIMPYSVKKAADIRTNCIVCPIISTYCGRNKVITVDVASSINQALIEENNVCFMITSSSFPSYCS